MTIKIPQDGQWHRWPGGPPPDWRFEPHLAIAMRNPRTDTIENRYDTPRVDDAQWNETSDAMIVAVRRQKVTAVVDIAGTSFCVVVDGSQLFGWAKE